MKPRQAALAKARDVMARVGSEGASLLYKGMFYSNPIGAGLELGATLDRSMKKKMMADEIRAGKARAEMSQKAFNLRQQVRLIRARKAQ